MSSTEGEATGEVLSEALRIADQLYSLRLEEFVPTRDSWARELKAEAPAVAATVASLRKPTVAAWVVNLFVRHEAERVTQMLQVGESLRQAQQDLDGEELRGLTRQRRQLTAALTTTARRLAAARGRQVSRDVAEQVEATLTAAMVDPGCAQAVRSGLLITPVRTTGTEEASVAATLALPAALGVVATPAVDREDAPGAEELHVVGGAESRAQERARAEAERRLADAEEDLREKNVATGRARSRAEQVRSRRQQLRTELEDARRRVKELQQQLESAESELSGAEQAVASAEAAEASAQQARDEAAGELRRRD